MTIQWTPWKVSMDRRLEVFAAFTFIAIVLFSETVTLSIFIWMLICGGTILRTFCILYLIFYFYDINADENNSRGHGSKLMRSWWVWTYFLKYFPIRMVKTVDLSPRKHYIFAAFPHGVICIGMFGNFVCYKSAFRKLFPGIRPRLCTLNFHFFVPIFREIAFGWGLMSAKKISIKNALSQSHDPLSATNNDGCTSNALGIVVGGAQEALIARPGLYKLILKRRKGFCKIAIESGACLVPVFSFNEVEVYDQPSNEPGTNLRIFQDFVKRWTGIAPACFIGRGFLQYSYGITPRRAPITTVVGGPIETVKNEKPTQSEIDELHENYTSALVKLFEDHKHKYLKNPEKVHLVIE